MKARQAARPVTSRTTPAVISCRRAGQGRFRRDRQAVRQAARGDDRGAQHLIERPGQVRARCVDEDDPCRLGPSEPGVTA
jgi:membrane protein required for beta-lactamase induction